MMQSVTWSGKMSGRKLRLCGQIGVKRMPGTFGCCFCLVCVCLLFWWAVFGFGRERETQGARFLAAGGV